MNARFAWTTLACALFAAAPVARALPPLMVAYRDVQHGPADLELGVLGTAFATTDGVSVDGAAGGGLTIAYARRGGWPEWSESVEWGVELRARVLASPLAGATALDVPVDLLARRGFVSHHSHLDTTGWPTEVFEPEPLVPYLGAGLTVDFVPDRGAVRAGPLLVAGLRWWLVPRFALSVELEVRALFGDARPVGQLGGSLGACVGL